MKAAERIPQLLGDLDENLTLAASLVGRGRAAYDSDPAIRLAFEALSNRIGDLCKQLVAGEPGRFSAPIWSQAARQRDFVVHHYHRVDYVALWETVTNALPALHELVVAEVAA